MTLDQEIQYALTMCWKINEPDCLVKPLAISRQEYWERRFQQQLDMEQNARDDMKELVSRLETEKYKLLNAAQPENRCYGNKYIKRKYR